MTLPTPADRGRVNIGVPLPASEENRRLEKIGRDSLFGCGSCQGIYAEIVGS
jgi:hypothetical protein